ncbi:TPA: two-component system response regulator DltR [Streptococcus agalactiae]|uniref:two-component system response regulator DltR n=1 Tax=Streptococcus agalactiae TaxID=1311 RepID=UPI0002B93D4D|nr:two-component system response regulator DltR [Streptococcus agalactiae]EPU98906.1 chemotaxis protein CheY [Streptococcus agalactiae GB00279]EPV31385.1 chemotaxis protein CheY [Streptococcus agalactiae GB00679]RDY73823.1 DNA-binding response regulator [Streptococcus agalactiae]CNI45768.1 DNA-binding response regulator [Streptococcus agalactiae]HEN2651735.1 response regulator transcription factor [Streptococcus agalactiae]
MRLLVVEDEKSIAEAIQALLADKGYSVDLVFDGDDGLEYILTGLYDLVLLDIMLPKRSGLSILKRVREAGLETPIIFLTAKSQTYDKVNGLDLGADDYITKPFEADELLARIRLRTRQSSLIRANQLRLENIRLNTDSHELESKESSVKLSNKEFLLMEVFMRNAKQIIPKNQLISKVWGPSDNSEYNQLEVFISFLRKKLRFLKADIEIITTKGFGYSLEEMT